MARPARKEDEASGRSENPPPEGVSIDREEVEKFSAMAAEWWDSEGKFRPLHRLNPTRLGFIRDRARTHFGRAFEAAGPASLTPLAGLRLLDIGCGGGLLAEPMCRLGASVTAIDASQRNISIARSHAAEQGLAVDYRAATAEALAEAGETFDIVLNMEVVEHVADRPAFLAASASLVAPGGMMVLATLNRTPKAFLMAVVGAEYLLRWLPRGTHDWRRFVRPSENSRDLRGAGLSVAEITGVVYNPVNERWRLDPGDLDVNYMMLAVRAA